LIFSLSPFLSINKPAWHFTICYRSHIQGSKTDNIINTSISKCRVDSRATGGRPTDQRYTWVHTPSTFRGRVPCAGRGSGREGEAPPTNGRVVNVRQAAIASVLCFLSGFHCSSWECPTVEWVAERPQNPFGPCRCHCAPNLGLFLRRVPLPDSFVFEFGASEKS